MYKICSLRMTTIAILSVLVVLSCTTNGPTPANIRIGYIIETIPEGILINFDAVPLDTTSMLIRFESRKYTEPGLAYSTDGSPLDSYNVFEAYAMITDELFEQIKNSKRIICPYVQPGAEYKIFISFFNEAGESNDRYIDTEFTAHTGIYPLNELVLAINEDNTSVRVSAVPVFSSGVEFPLNKYSFSFVIISEQGVFGTSTDILEEELKWDFEPLISESMELWKKEALLRGKDIRGSHPAWITFSCNLLYENIQWKVDLAKTPIFTYSL